ncbi:MAG: ROK family transcriptional regulator [Bacteroidetes bacterium]|nr:ROK family transcriptional regulator [Bacteroidota bacterium]
MNVDPIFSRADMMEENSSIRLKKFLLKKRIVQLLYLEGNKSIPDIGRATGMSIPTITRTINELIDEGLVLDNGIGASIGGRRPNLYLLNPEARYVLGIDMGRFSTRISILNLSRQIISSDGIIVSELENDESIVEKIFQKAKELIANTGIDYRKLIGVGVAFPGLIDAKSGMSQTYKNFSDRPLSKFFEDKFDLPVFVENDARVMALGESYFGLAQGKENVLCLNIGAGIGLGMILNGKLYRGNSGFAGEFGHFEVEPEGKLCICGKRGCLETVASGSAIAKRAQIDMANGMISILGRLTDETPDRIDAETVVKAAQLEDQYAIGLLSEMGEQLGKGIAVLINIFNPEMIILGGKIGMAENYIIDPLQLSLNKYAISRIKRDCQIVTSKLREKSALLGAFALVIDKIFEDLKEYPNNKF